MKEEGGLPGQGRRCLESAPVLGLNWLNKAEIADQNGVPSQKEKGIQRLSSKYELERKQNETQSKAGTVNLDLYHVAGRHYLCRVQEERRSIVCFQPAFRLSDGFHLHQVSEHLKIPPRHNADSCWVSKNSSNCTTGNYVVANVSHH